MGRYVPLPQLTRDPMVKRDLARVALLTQLDDAPRRCGGTFSQN
jgi:hypothetical protein